MIRFSQRLGCYIGIPLIPSTDILTAEDHRVCVSRRGGLVTRISDSNTGKHPDPPSQDVEQNIGATQDAHHSSTSGNTPIVTIDQQKVNSPGTEQIDPELHLDRSTRVAKEARFQSLPSNSQAIEQGVGTTFQDAHHFSISGNARIVNIGQQNVNNQVTYGLDALEKFVSFSALHDSSAQDPERCCHPGTRKSVLQKMHAWIDDPNAPERILWLHGPAGVGKSAIAQTISYSYGRDKIGATFFFFRSDPVRNDGNRLFPTLAWQLALSIPIVKDRIVFSLKEYPDLPRKTIEAQFKRFIAEPFLTISGESAASTSDRVIIIDGLDECSDVKLQRRILKIIESAVSDPRFPLRFIIISRPEAHIEDFFTQFQHPTLQIDLANVDGAYRDIETYLTSELHRIAVEQELDPEMWPNWSAVNTLVSKSSGQFVYASTVIKCVGNEYESAVEQLNIILGLKPSTGESPFLELDALYTEILQRQPDKRFLRDFLAVVVACSALSLELSLQNLHEDYAMLLGLDQKELHRKLRGMHSLLKSKPFIDIHHKSFLDFLDDSSRSSKYHVSKDFANRRYLELITDLLAKAALRAMEQPNSHEGGHFKPEFVTVIKSFPLPIKLPLDDLEEVLQPLLIIQENLLQLPNMSVPWKPRACHECRTFCMIDGLLLHLAWFRGTTRIQGLQYVGIRPLAAVEAKQSTPQLDLDTCLSLLLANLRSVELSLNMETVSLMRALVRFDPTVTAMKIRSITDAQNLVEFIFCLNKNECFKSWFGVLADNATRLAVAIYGRVPLLPRSLFLNSADLDGYGDTYQGKAVKICNPSAPFKQKCFDAFMWGSLSHGSMGPLLGICFSWWSMLEVFTLPESSAVDAWRRSTNPSVSKMQQIFFEIAKAIQYIHSLGIMLSYPFDERDVYVDSDNHVKLQCPGFCPNDLCKEQFDYDSYDDSTYTLDDDIYWLGAFFYEILFNRCHQGVFRALFNDDEDEDEDIDKVTFKIRPSDPEVPDNVRQLIQWCCAKDPKERPTMDQVVQEMESWISLGQFTLS